MLLKWSHLKEVTKSLSAASAGLQKERRWASSGYADAAALLEGSDPELSHPFLLSSSCVSTISSSVWRASTRQLATAELRNAESGLTEEKNDNKKKKIKTDKSKHIPCRDVCSHPSLHRGEKGCTLILRTSRRPKPREMNGFTRTFIRTEPGNVTRM